MLCTRCDTVRRYSTVFVCYAGVTLRSWSYYLGSTHSEWAALRGNNSVFPGPYVSLYYQRNSWRT